MKFLSLVALCFTASTAAATVIDGTLAELVAGPRENYVLTPSVAPHFIFVISSDAWISGEIKRIARTCANGLGGRVRLSGQLDLDSMGNLILRVDKSPVVLL